MDSNNLQVAPSSPSAPLPTSSGSPHGGSRSPRKIESKCGPSGDADLMKDLLRKAKGDSSKVAMWLSEMGLNIDSQQIEAARFNSKHGDDRDSTADRLGAPDAFFCPVSMHLMRDPVLIPTGQTYERRAIVKWLSEGTLTCPATGIALSSPVPLTPNVALRKSIEDWVEKQAPWMLDSDGRLPEIEDTDGHLKLQNGAANPTVDTADRDLALALRLHDEETVRASSRRLRSQVMDGTHQDQDHRNYRTSRSRSMRKKMQRSLHMLLTLTLTHFGFFLYTLFLNSWEFESINRNPLIGFSAKVIDQVGGTDSSQIADSNQWWRLLTSQFTTAGVVHMEATIGSLWTFGNFLAAKLSFASLGLLYLTSGFAGILLSANISTDMVTAGGSSGSFGLIGAMFVELLLHRKQYQMSMVSICVLMCVVIINAIIGLTPLVDNWANIGGLVTGLLTGIALLLSQLQANHGGFSDCFLVLFQIMFGITVILFLLAGALGILSGWQGGRECSWCRKVACYDTEWWKCESARILPEDCAFNIRGNLTASIECPSGHMEHIPIPAPTQENLERLCSEICSLRRSKPSINFPSTDQGLGDVPDLSGDGLDIPRADTTSNLA